VQSGNVVFVAAEKDLGKLARRIEAAIEREFGFHSDVILRSASHMRSTVERNPFSGRVDVQPAKLAVTFLPEEPAAGAMEKLLAIPAGGEEPRLVGRELYVHYPNGMGQATLNLNAIVRALGITGTARNWNTVTKLLEMAECAE
jgi:uncharacterized protein (DUF1697 family)